ncbi:MAG: right-handed parallel beta-helix repeat-containing protein [Sulfuricurvum sp.]|nr:right-handed parallel beta-helix repeat-containing protein [Sulfuricurvum sp.]
MANYYLSNSGSDLADGLSEATAWATIAKHNATSIAAGSSVLFRRGDTFTGQLVPKSGTLGNLVAYGMYGTGAKPIFSGFETLSGWTLHSGTIWKANTSAAATLNMVTVNGVNTPKKNNPVWSTYESHSGNTSITDTTLSGTPSLIGAQVVVRNSRWKMEVSTISGHSGNTLTFDALTDTPTDGYGYFIQNSVNLLSNIYDWCISGGIFYMNFGVYTPAVKTVKVSITDTLISSISKSYWSIENIAITGANDRAVKIYNPISLSIKNCDFSFCGKLGIEADGSPVSSALTIESNTFTSIGSCAVYSTSEAATIKLNTLLNIGMLAGMGDDNWGDYCGISSIGNSSTIEKNRITNCGYSSIVFRGTNTLVKNNFVDGFCSVLDDGGGIYSSTVTPTGRIIDGNIVVNGYSAMAGQPSPYTATYGIYLDERAADVIIRNNTVANVLSGGILLHVSTDVDITSNKVFNCATQLYLSNNQAGYPVMANVNITGNEFVAKEASQKCLIFYSIYDDLAFGSASGNVYARPIDDTQVFSIDKYNTNAVLYDLAGWKTLSSYDASSTKSPKAITAASEIALYYNDTDTPVVVSLPAAKMGMTGTIYASEITLPAYGSAILLNHSVKFLVNAAGKKLKLSTGKLLIK